MHQFQAAALQVLKLHAGDGDEQPETSRLLFLVGKNMNNQLQADAQAQRLGAEGRAG